MLFELKADVSVRTLSGSFVTVEAGHKVNYSSHKRLDGYWVHKFSALVRVGRTVEIVDHIAVCQGEERPEWL